ncbi:MAG: zinc-ribbon domain-containing protein [Acidobacteriales bacterium]|nr:zinc-ribbon domain-containing protein [Terriglobales bacterium]
MSFCTSCGAQADPSAAFCPKCGAGLAPVPPPIPAPGSTVQRPSSGLKILLMVLGGIFLLVVLIIGGAVFFVKKTIDRSSMETSDDGKQVKVETPFGSIETTKDTEKILEKMGVEAYPGAEPAEHGASSMTMNNVEVMNAMFDTEDTADQVLAFYRGKFPSAEVFDTPENKTLMEGDKSKSSLLIAIHEADGRTRITITKTTKLEK